MDKTGKNILFLKSLASYTIGTEPFPGLKRPGRGVGHSPPSSAEVKE
jgi:hypothetical protein